jgi:hypothetical protein
MDAQVTTTQTFQAKFYIDKRDVGMVLGGKGKTINGIKRTHGVDVRIMDSDRADGKQFFLITGSDHSKVDAAYKNVDQIAANSERKRQSGASPQVHETSRGYGSPQVQTFHQHGAPPGYTVFINGANYIIPHGMMLVPVPTMTQDPMTPQGGYSSVPITPHKNKGGRKVRRKKPVPPVLAPTTDFAPTFRQPRPVPVMPQSPSYNPTSPTYNPPGDAFVPKSPDYSPHTPEDPSPGHIVDWAAEANGTGADSQ